MATVVMLAAPTAPHRHDGDDMARALLDHISDARQGVVGARRLAALGVLDGPAVNRSEVRLAAAADSVVLYTKGE